MAKLFSKIKNKVFFWTKKGPQVPKAEEMILAFIKYLPKIREAVKSEQDKMFNRGNLLKCMYDFYEDIEGDMIPNPRMPRFLDNEGLMPVPALPSADTREIKTPVEVVAELEKVPIKIDLVNLDEKINLFKSKTKLLSQRFAADQVNGFVKRLLNRKHYEAHHVFYEQFPFTNDEAIDKLLGKYKLVMKKSDLFVPTFPKEAIDIMEKYSDETKKFTDEAPVFYVIAEEADFEKKRKKLDPILLVQSPFGFYWQILGAWDKEMLLLGEL